MEVCDTSQQKNYPWKPLVNSFTQLLKNYQHLTPKNASNPSIGNYVVYYVVDGSLILKTNINTPPLNNFGEMYTIEFKNGVYNMVQLESF